MLGVAAGAVVAVIGYQRLGRSDVEGTLAGYRLIDPETVSVTISVTRLDPSRPVDCIVRVRAKDGSETGRREVLVPPGQEQAFEEAVRASAGDTNWVVYAVNAGMPEGSYLMFAALTEMKQLDKDVGTARLSQFPGETNFYVVRPDMSHVSKEFAAGDPGFWLRRAGP